MPLIMGLYLKMAGWLHSADATEASFSADLGHFDRYILGYAVRCGVPVAWPRSHEVLVSEPPVLRPLALDPWDLEAGLCEYVADFGQTGEYGVRVIGGDSLDLTTDRWASLRQEAESRERMDPWPR